MSIENEGSATFFYGTLMHPKILKRVIGNDGTHLYIAPAVLLEYTRHKVKHADYPGVVPVTKGQTLFDRELEREERSVRGTFVTGLTERDLRMLDYFEGAEYTREKILVHPLEPLLPLNESINILPKKEVLENPAPPHLPTPEDLPAPVEAQTYIYRNLNYLEPSLWSFEEFVHQNAWKWYGKGAEDNEEFTEIDKRNANTAAEVAK